MKKIKVTIDTGWANGEHVDYYDLPSHWDSLSDEDKQDLINDYSQEYLQEQC